MNKNKVLTVFLVLITTLIFLLFIYIAVRLSMDSGVCVQNPIAYYERIMDAKCMCNNQIYVP